MALTSYGAHNLVIEQDYNLRFNEIVAGEPEVTVTSLSGGGSEVYIDTWYRAKQEETARWRWVGMDYHTAQSCADTIRSGLTFSKYVWQFGTYIVQGKLNYGYYKEKSAPMLESDVTIIKNGNGAMYDVVVDAHVTDENFSKTAGVSIGTSRNLADYINYIDGWNSNISGWNNGHAISAAGANNIVLVTAPTRVRSFELVGQDILPIGGESGLSSVVFPIWYKCTDRYTCQVKYTGMTLGACRSLFNNLNSTTGWFYKYHPYEYKYDYQQHEFSWQENSEKDLYQCLNEYKATKGDGNMWTAELNLCQEVFQYTKNPQSANNWSWPSLWSTKIPGLANYL